MHDDTSFWFNAIPSKCKSVFTDTFKWGIAMEELLHRATCQGLRPLLPQMASRAASLNRELKRARKLNPKPIRALAPAHDGGFFGLCV